MPYLTEFNESRIIEDLTTEIDYNVTPTHIYHRTIPFFNKLELSQLNDYRRFCEGDIELESVYKKAEKIDRKKFVFEGNAPSYHRDKECRFLHSRFKNIELPEEVQNWADDDIEEFRKWFKIDINDIENDELIQSKLIEEWGISTKIHRANFRNSGSIYKENLEIHKIEKRIDSLLESQRSFYQKNRYYLARFSKATFLAFRANEIENNETNLSDEELKEKLRLYHNLFKEPVKHYLKEYYKVKYSTEVKFEERLLESLGFKKCQACYSNKVESSVVDLTKNKSSNEKTDLDIFLESRHAKRLCKTPDELLANKCSENSEFLEFYYFCKLMALLNTEVEIKGRIFQEVVIEYIFKDRIYYEKALFDESQNGIDLGDLELFNGYLVYTRFKPNDRVNVWREMFKYDYEEPTNFF